MHTVEHTGTRSIAHPTKRVQPCSKIVACHPAGVDVCHFAIYEVRVGEVIVWTTSMNSRPAITIETNSLSHVDIRTARTHCDRCRHRAFGAAVEMATELIHLSAIRKRNDTIYAQTQFVRTFSTFCDIPSALLTKTSRVDDDS